MTLKEWSKEVKKALIDQEKTDAQMSRDLECTTQYVYQTMGGTEPRQIMVDRISAYVGIEPIKL